MRHLTHTDPAQPEFPVDRLGPPAALAAGVGPHRELRLAGGLNDQRLLRHQLSLKGKPRRRRSARPSSSVVAEVTTVMSMPRCRSMESGLISWNIDCSVRPKV